MANFNSSKWYQLQLGGSVNAQSLSGTGVFDAGKGAVFFENTNTTDPQQMWQLFPYNTTYYIMRTAASGQYAYMAAKVGADNGAQNTGNTVPITANVSIADNSIFWTITPWRDGTFYLTNAANGTDWHLQEDSNSLLEMSSDIVAPQPGQRFSFNVQGDIVNRPGFKSVLLPPSLSTSTSTTSTGTASPTGSTPATSSASTSSGLSTGAKAGIGAGIGIVALIALLALGFFFLRRRKSRAQTPFSYPLTENYSGERKSMMHTDPQELGVFTDAYVSDNQKKSTLSLQELDPTAVAMHEMEGGTDRERNGRSVSQYRPGVDNEQKAVMPQGFFKENVAVEMDAHQHPMGVSALPGTDEQRGR